MVEVVGMERRHLSWQREFQVIKQHFGFQKTRLRGLAKNRCKINVIAALTNLFLARRRLLATP